MSVSTSDYRISNAIFRVTYGDITKVNADALVSSDDNYLSMGGGVSWALLKAGGETIQQEARKHIPLKLGSVAVTSAGNLPAKFIFHAVTIDYDKMENANENTIRIATQRCMDLADNLGVHHIAFPALGTGVAHFPFQLAAEIMTETIAQHLLGKTLIELVTLTLFRREGVTETDVNRFYERATAVAAMASQGRRMKELLSELRRMIKPMQRPDLIRQMVDLEAQLTQAMQILAERPDTLEGMDELATRSNIAILSQDIVSLTTQTQELKMWEDKEGEATTIRLKLQGQRAVLNIQCANLNKLLEKRAKYGTADSPLYLENEIEDVQGSIKESEAKITQLSKQLAAFIGKS